MKKLLLSLGTVAAVVAPVAAVVACGTSERDTAINKMKKDAGYSKMSAAEKKIFDEGMKLLKTEDLKQEISKDEIEKFEAIVKLGVKDLTFENTLKFDASSNVPKSPLDLDGEFTLKFKVTKSGSIDSVDIEANQEVVVEYKLGNGEAASLCINSIDVTPEGIDSPYPHNVNSLNEFDKFVQELALKKTVITKEHRAFVKKMYDEHQPTQEEIKDLGKNANEIMAKTIEKMNNAKNVLDYFHMIGDTASNSSDEETDE